MAVDFLFLLSPVFKSEKVLWWGGADFHHVVACSRRAEKFGESFPVPIGILELTTAKIQIVGEFMEKQISKIGVMR